MTRFVSSLCDWHDRLRHYAFTGCLALMAMLAAAPIVSAQEEEIEEPLETRVYYIADLTMQVADYDYHGTQTPVLHLGGAATRSSWSGGMGTGGGGMGGGMGGMGGGMGGSGGGVFSVPDQVQAQVAAPVSATASGNIVQRRSGVNLKDLVSLITSSIDFATWSDSGGNGTIDELGGMLVITQAPSIHKKVDELLKAIRANAEKQRSVTIRATWLLLDAKQLGRFEFDSAGGADSNRRAVVSQLAGEAAGYRGQITCFDGQTVHLVAGRARSKIIGAIPVVGGAGVGYQPVTAVPQTGAVLQVTPRLSADGKSVILDVHSSVVEEHVVANPTAFLAAPSEQIVPTKPGEAAAAPNGTLNIDRVNLLVQQFMTTVRIPTGKPVLLGGLTQEPTSSDAKAADAPQLYLFVEADLLDATK